MLLLSTPSKRVESLIEVFSEVYLYLSALSPSLLPGPSFIANIEWGISHMLSCETSFASFHLLPRVFVNK